MSSHRPNLVLERLASLCLATACLFVAGITALGGIPKPEPLGGGFKLGLFTVTVLCCILSIRKRVLDFSFVFGAAAVLFNPLFTLPLSERDMIIALMLLTALFCWVFLAPLRSAAAAAASAVPPVPTPPISPVAATPPQDATVEQATVVETIHLVLGGPPPGTPFTADNIVVTGTAVRTVDAAGRRGMEVRTFKGADTLTYLEASAAIYWQNQIDDNTIYLGKALKWLRAIGEQTGTHYLHNKPGERVTEMQIITGLATISLHYAVAYHRRLGLPGEVELFLTDHGPQSFRVLRPHLYASASKLKEVMDDKDKLSPLHGPFFDHIQSSIPWATGTKVDHLNPT